MTPVSDRLPSPNLMIAGLVVGQIVLWSLAPAISHISPPLDVMESYMWGREWVIATYKHPSMPSWLLELSFLLTGAYGWPAYIISQLFIAASFVFVFLLGRDLMGPERAAAGTLLLTGIAYYAWWTPELKHNIAETPFWAGLPWLLWRAVERRSLGWWLLAGAFAGVGMYARLTVGLLVATAAIWMLADRRARESLLTPGPWLAAIVFAVLCIPLARWLVATDFLPLTYAAGRAGRSPGVGNFLLTTLLNLSGVFAMLALAGLLRWPWSRENDSGAAVPVRSQQDKRALLLLATFTFAPIGFAVGGALLTSGGLKTGWGNSLLNFVGLLAVLLLSHRFSRQSLRTIAVCAAILVVTLPAGYALVVGLGPQVRGMAGRVHWPQAEISRRFEAIWAKETGLPLRIVTGDSWVAGLVGLTAKDRPSILNDGDLERSQWITPARIDAQGMLAVWDARAKEPPKALQPMLAGRPVREEAFAWPRSRRKQPIVIRYAIIPPKS